MVEIIKPGPDLSIQEKINRGPLKGLREIREYQWKIIEVNDTHFPGIFVHQPELLKRRRPRGKEKNKTGLFTYVHSSSPIAFSELLGLGPKFHMDLDTLLFLQKTTIYPSQTIKAIKIDSEWHGTAYDYYLRSFSHEDVRIDDRYGYPTGATDRGVNMYLTLQLALQKAKDGNDRPVINLEGLKSYAQRLHLSVDSSGLSQAFSSICGRKNIDMLIQQGVLREQELEKYYQRIAEWQLDLSEDLSRGNNLVAPFSTLLDSEDYPSVDFLPYIVENYLMYISELPLFVKKQENVNLGRIYGWLSDLYGLHDRAGRKDGFIDLLVMYWATHTPTGPHLARKLQDIKRSCNDLYPDFENLIKFYRKNPQLLRGEKYEGQPESALKNLQDLYLLIQDAGGRVPRRGLRRKLLQFDERTI